MLIQLLRVSAYECVHYYMYIQATTIELISLSLSLFF